MPVNGRLILGANRQTLRYQAGCLTSHFTTLENLFDIRGFDFCVWTMMKKAGKIWATHPCGNKMIGRFASTNTPVMVFLEFSVLTVLSSCTENGNILASMVQISAPP